MKVVILGASGIIGQHMRLRVPDGVEPVWVRRHSDPLHRVVDLADAAATEAFLEAEHPRVVVNLAGESRPDVVERDPIATEAINVDLPGRLAVWCDRAGAQLVHVSTQAVFDGMNPPYSPASRLGAVNAYGRQKIAAEMRVREVAGDWIIVRPTFVLGVRPIPRAGRPNPIELILEEDVPVAADDRWFSVSFADRVASAIWSIVAGARARSIVHVGSHRVSRYGLAEIVRPGVALCVHQADFLGAAPRPVDTTYHAEALYAGASEDLSVDVAACRAALASRRAIDLVQRAREIALFTGTSETACLAKLQRGFGALHGEVAADFRRAAPKDDGALLEWYRQTDAYIWELSAYHADPGFNYSGMCAGVVERLRAAGARHVLCLGDGIGDMTLALRRAGMAGVYHDLAGSRTAAFARARLWMYSGEEGGCAETSGWAPEIPTGFDAVTAFDFLEHVTDVPAWVAAIHRALRPGGLFFAQNAFAIGSGDDGSIPMHLQRNDRFEKDWDPMLVEIGFEQLDSNWYVRR